MLSEIIQSFFMMTLLLAALAMPVLGAKPDGQEGRQFPDYCIESHPDYDAEKCETEEDPLYRWRQLQEERAADNSASKDQGCLKECLTPPNSVEEDPLVAWRNLQCHRICKDTNKPK